MSFKLIHLKIDKENFEPLWRGANDNRTIVMLRPNYNLLMKLIKIVGGESGWHLRREYAEKHSIATLKHKIADKNSCLFIFKEADDVVGFCQVLNSTALNEIFQNNSKVIEIYKFGLFPDRIGKGRGQFYLSSVMEELFMRGYQTIYLNTRDTNKVKSVQFYQRMGMQVISEEEKPDDLVSQSVFGARLTRRPSIDLSKIIWQESREFS